MRYNMPVLQKFREGLTLVLLAALPLHALAVTLFTKLIAGPGHSPMTILALWKEALLAVILFSAFIEILRTIKKLSFDRIDLLILALIALSIIVTSYQLPVTSTRAFAMGFRYDFLPLIAFFILRRVSWSEAFQKNILKVLLGVGVIIAAYGIATFFLPLSFFTALGYSDLHSLYVPDGPLAAFQQIGGSALRRIQSTMSGPNQFGLWLLIPVSILLAMIATRLKIQDVRYKEDQRIKIKNLLSFKLLPSLYLVSFILVLAALLLSFSRSAWVAAAVISAVAFLPHLSVKKIQGLAVALCALVLVAAVAFPSLFLRFASSKGHIDRPLEAIQTMVAHPFGLGLGTAGPASNRTSDSCVMLQPQDDPSWAIPHQQLCVFLGDKQVQPLDRVCNCPILTENWYLQIGVELGWIGMGLWILLTIVLLRSLYGRYKTEDGSLYLTSFILFLGLSIAALFLHSWEDSAVAWTIWILVATTLTTRKTSPHS